MDAQTVTYLIALFGMAALYHWLLRGQRKRNAELYDMVDQLAKERDDMLFKLQTAQQDSVVARETSQHLRSNNLKLRRSLAALQRQLNQP